MHITLREGEPLPEESKECLGFILTVCAMNLFCTFSCAHSQRMPEESPTPSESIDARISSLRPCVHASLVAGYVFQKWASAVRAISGTSWEELNERRTRLIDKDIARAIAG